MTFRQHFIDSQDKTYNFSLPSIRIRRSANCLICRVSSRTSHCVSNQKRDTFATNLKSKTGTARVGCLRLVNGWVSPTSAKAARG